MEKVTCDSRGNLLTGESGRERHSGVNNFLPQSSRVAPVKVVFTGLSLLFTAC